MGAREREAILARFGEHTRKRVGRKILKLVNEKKKILALTFWNIAPRHGCELKLSRQQGTEQVRFVSTKFSFR